MGVHGATEELPAVNLRQPRILEFWDALINVESIPAPTEDDGPAFTEIYEHLMGSGREPLPVRPE